MKLGFILYLLFTASWFLRLPARITILGVVRFDLLLVLLISVIIILNLKKIQEEKVPNDTDFYLKLLIGYIILTIPLVQWPGSVLHANLPEFIKGVVFYFFTVKLITTEYRLKVFLLTFVSCQAFRVIEPVYLNLTQGYWGSAASMAGWEMMDRLAGAPHDIINPNGLAFVILTILPFLYYFFSYSFKMRILCLSIACISLYALVLTGSRSGFVAFLILAIFIAFKSRQKIIAFLILFIGLIAIFANLDAPLQDRYMSIWESDTSHGATATGRIEGIKEDFSVAFQRPLFGHGLGTSREANWNVRGSDQISHNLYAEVSIELGFIGLLFFLMFMYAIIKNFIHNQRFFEKTNSKSIFLVQANKAMQAWIVMNIVFSFASYGLSSYEWYLFAGFAVSINQIMHNKNTQHSNIII